MILRMLSYLRYPIGVVFFIIHTVVLCIGMALLYFAHSRKAEQLICRMWGQGVLWAFNVRPHITGLENIPKQGVLFLFHHTSWFDIWILHSTILRVSRFGSKAELFKIPILSTAMRVAGVLPIAREKRTEVFKVYKEAETRFADGESFFLAPEGTRQNQPEIGPFKKGPFLFALNAGVPIVPIVLYGAHTIMPKGSFLIGWGNWRTDVDVRVLPAIDVRDFDQSTIAVLQEKVRSQMQSVLAEMKQDRQRTAKSRVSPSSLSSPQHIAKIPHQ